MAVQPPGSSSSQPTQPPAENPQQIAQTLSDHLTRFIEGVRKIMDNPHLAESSTLDALAATIEHLKNAAKKAANFKG